MSTVTVKTAPSITTDKFDGLVGKMNYRDLKKHCIVRGMPFNEVVGGSFPQLQNWLYFNYDNKKTKNLVNDYDRWIEEELKDSPDVDSLTHPQLRLGFIGPDEDVKPKTSKKIIKVKKKKKEKTSDGIFKGTKKALTFELQKKGKSLDRTIKRVLKVFPEASEKSIKIWYKKSARMQNA